MGNSARGREVSPKGLLITPFSTKFEKQLIEDNRKRAIDYLA